MHATLAVELWSAAISWRQGFIEQLEVPTPVVADVPVREAAARTDGTSLVVGRHPGSGADVDHLTWGAGSGDDEDVQLSRSQLRFDRRGAEWRVTVPGPGHSRRPAAIRSWASAGQHRLEAGGPPAVLVPDARVGLTVATRTRCYWALTRTPGRPGTTPAPPTPGRGSSTRAEVTGLRRAEDPTEWLARRPRFPAGWREAVTVRFRPFLTGPMDLDPALVEPRNFTRPGAGPGGVTPAFRASVKRRLVDTQAAAAARGFLPRLPSAVDDRLLEWLVDVGMITFEEDRVPWAPE